MFKRVITTLCAMAMSAPLWAHPSFAPPPVHVKTMTLHPKTLQASQTFLGSLSAVHGLMIKAEVAGRLTTVAVKSGQHVQQGQLLAQTNPEVLQAQLRGAISARTLAQNDQKRMQKLLQTHVVSQQDYERSNDTYRHAQAQVDTLQAQLRQTEIRAPFSGRLGIVQLQQGDVITPGSAFARLEDPRTLWVDFAIPQSQINIRHKIHHILVYTNDPKQALPAQWVADNATLDDHTRQLHVRARLDNQAMRFMPGTFVMVQVALGAPTARIMIPQYAIAYTAKGPTVYRWVKQKAVRTPIQTGEIHNGLIEVRHGLHDQDTIITAGQHKLFPNAVVIVDSAPSPGGQAA